jgi:tetratricopeptide (TPR) repeat protein
MKNLVRLSRSRLLVCVADVGYNREHELLDYHYPEPMLAGSCYMGVNFDAIGRWVRHQGGLALHTTPRDSALELSVFALGAGQAGISSGLPETSLAFDEAIDGFGPLDFHSLHEGRLAEPLSLDQILSLLRLSDWDPLTLYEHAKDIAEQAAGAPAVLQDELALALERTWQNHYTIGDEDKLANMPFVMGWIQASMNRHREAIGFFERSLEQFGEEPTAFYNLGLSLYRIGEPERAIECFRKYEELGGDAREAAGWIRALEKETRRR